MPVLALAALALPASAAATTWHATNNMPYFTWGAAGGVVGGQYVLTGGFGFDTNTTYGPLKSAFSATNGPGIDHWTRRTGQPSARGGAGYAVDTTNDNLYVVGGAGSTGNPVVGMLRWHAGTWTSMAPMPNARTDLAAVWTPTGAAGRVFAIGGYTVSGGNLLPTLNVQIYDIQTNSWTAGPPLPSPIGGESATVGADGKIYVFGGWNQRQLRTAYVLDPANLGGGWTQLADMPSPHEIPGAVTGNDGTLYVVGGWDGARDLRRVDAYDTATDTWSCTAPLTNARSWPVAVNDGTNLSVLGGVRGNTLLASTESIASSALPTGDVTPPVVTSAPTAHIPTGGTAATSGMPVVVRWTATDAATDILDQHLELSQDAGTTWAAVTGIWPSLQPVYFNMGSVRNWRFRATPTDCAGNAAPTSNGGGFSTRVASEAALRVAGQWHTASGSANQGGHTRYSTQAGARARFDFTGLEITLLAPKSALRGAARISIDGKFVANVSEYSKTLVSRALLWHHEFPHGGTHYVTVTVLGTKGRPRFDIDGYFVIGGPMGLSGRASSSARVTHAAVASATRGGHPARSLER